MSSLWPQFLYPWLLLLAPLAWLVIGYRYRQQQRPVWQQQLPDNFRRWLLRQPDPHNARMPQRLLALAALFASLALAGPQWPATPDPARPDLPPPLILLLELTPDMLASDLPPDRLHRIRHKAAQLLQLQTPGDTAVILYAGSAHVMTPFSNDPEVALNMLPALSPGLMPVPGRNAVAAVEQALALLDRHHPPHGRLLLLTRDLSDTEQQGIRQLLHGSRNRLHIIGVGSLEGAPLPAAGSDRFSLDSPLSRLQETRLQNFANSLPDTRYARLTLDYQDLQQSGLLTASSQTGVRMQQPEQLEPQGHWFLLPLLLVLAPLGRRGWISPALVLLASQLWCNPGYAGQWPVTDEPPTRTTPADDPFWQAVAAYQAGQYQQAADGFAAVPGAVALYNRGNSLLQLDQPAAARLAYLEALQLMPGLPQAQHNLALAERLLQSGLPPTRPAPHGAGDKDTQAVSNKTATLGPPSGSPEDSDPDTWLRQIPDHPGELLRQRFWNEQFHRAD